MRSLIYFRRRLKGTPKVRLTMQWRRQAVKSRVKWRHLVTPAVQLKTPINAHKVSTN